MFKAIRNLYYKIMSPTLKAIGAPAKVSTFLLCPNTTDKYRLGLWSMIVSWFISFGGLAVFLCQVIGLENFGLSGTQTGVLVMVSCVFGFVFLWGLELYEEALPHQKRLKARKQGVKVL